MIGQWPIRIVIWQLLSHNHYAKTTLWANLCLSSLLPFPHFFLPPLSHFPLLPFPPSSDFLLPPLGPADGGQAGRCGGISVVRERRRGEQRLPVQREGWFWWHRKQGDTQGHPEDTQETSEWVVRGAATCLRKSLSINSGHRDTLQLDMGLQAQKRLRTEVSFLHYISFVTYMFSLLCIFAKRDI